jgi:hypothetical protein
MGTVTIKYGTNQLEWSPGDTVNAVDATAVLSVTHNSVYTPLRTFDSVQEAEAARERLVTEINDGLGNGDVIIVIDDF